MTTRTPPSGWLSRLAQGSLVKNICFNNARDYFAIELN